MTITNVTDRELAVARQFEALKGVYRRDHETSQAKIEELRAEVAELKVSLEKEQALTAHHRTVQVELLSKVAELKAEHIAYISRTGARILALHDELGELKAKLADAEQLIKSKRELLQEAQDELDKETGRADRAEKKLAEYEKRYPKSAAETHPMIPNSKCKCEHWQRCPECTPSLKGTP